jgi:hypothetical protein
MNITATGMQGFLLWLKNNPQTSSVYNSLRPQLSAMLDVSPTGLGQLTDSIVASAPADSADSASIVPQVANLINAACCVSPQVQATISAQLKQAYYGQAPLSDCQIGELYMGASRIRLGNTCFTFGTTELAGGDLLLVLAGAAVLVGIWLFHRK